MNHRAPVAPARGDLHVEVVESLDALDAIDDEYHRLLDASLGGRGFWYHVPAMRALAPVHASGRRAPFVLLARAAGSLVAALPLVLERKSITRAGVRVLSLWGGDGSALGVEGDVPVTGEPERALRAFRVALEGPLRARFDVLDLGYLRGDSTALPALQRVFRDGRWSPEPLSSHHLELPESFAEYRATRSGGRLRELGRMRRQLERDHAVEWRVTAALTHTERDEVLQLHNARQQQLASRGRMREFVSASPRHRAAIEAVLELTARSGHARHHLLRADGRLVAFLLTLVSDDTVLAWLTAVHGDFARFGPGGLVFWEAVQREFERGEGAQRDVRRIEYGPGTTFVKETVATHALTPQHVRWMPPHGALSHLRVHTWEWLVQARQRAAGNDG